MLAAVPTRARPTPDDLLKYTATFTSQFGIPYSHRFLELYKAEKMPLQKEDFHPF